MADEQDPTGGGDNQDPTNNQEPAGNQAPAGDQQQQSPPGDKVMTVDIHGVSVSVDEETAQKIIEKRQASKEQLRQLETQLEDARRTREDAERRARAAEAAKEGDITKVERELTEQYTQRLDKMHRAVVRSNVEAALRAHPDFIGGEASTKDAVSMLVSSGELQVDEQTLTVKSGEKDVNQVVGEFLAARDYFRKARPGPRGPRGDQNQPHQQPQGTARAELPRKSIAEGLSNRYGGA